MNGAPKVDLAYCLVLALLERHKKILGAGMSLPPGFRELEALAVSATTFNQHIPNETTNEGLDSGMGQAVIDEQRKFFSPKEVADMGPKNERQIRRLIAKGELACGPLGIPRGEVDRLSNMKGKP